MWFENLTGLEEESPDQVREMLVMEGDTLHSLANGKSFRYGQLEIPSLQELRARTSQLSFPDGTLKLDEYIAEIQELHLDPSNANSLIQVASQFNLLEMISPGITPEMGIDRYEYDPTQGPACAIACGAGTIWRNYFVEIDGKPGQRADRQIDTMADLGRKQKGLVIVIAF